MKNQKKQPLTIAASIRMNNMWYGQQVIRDTPDLFCPQQVANAYGLLRKSQCTSVCVSALNRAKKLGKGIKSKHDRNYFRAILSDIQRMIEDAAVLHHSQIQISPQ